MRHVGLTLCLLASSFAARAEAAEDRVLALEARVKALEQALGVPGAPAPEVPQLDGGHPAAVESGAPIEFAKNH